MILRTCLGGAGGIGGLLASQDTGGTSTTSDDRTFLYFYDGNGNVGQLLETTAGTNYGTIAAKYEYDAFGNSLLDPANATESGAYAGTNAFRFSTKWYDAEIGASYFGERYYDAARGRWLNRDPIGEMGGINLYEAMAGDPINSVDPLGLEVLEFSFETPNGTVYEYRYVDRSGNICGREICTIPADSRCGQAIREATRKAAERYKPWLDSARDFAGSAIYAPKAALDGVISAISSPTETVQKIGAAYNETTARFGADGSSAAAARAIATGIATAAGLDAAVSALEGQDAYGNPWAASDYGGFAGDVATSVAGGAVAGAGASK